MGLDSVELLIAFEEEFGIRFADDEAAQMTTIAEAADIILERLQDESSHTCRTRSAFYRIRKALVTTSEEPHPRIRPDTPLGELLPRSTRRADWKRLSKTLGSEGMLPELCRPRLVARSILVVAIALGIGTGLSTESVWAACLVAVLIGVVGFEATTPLAREFTAGADTTGELARWWVSGMDSLPPGSLNRDSIVNTVIRLTCEQLGHKPNKVKEHMKFVDDLGLD